MSRVFIAIIALTLFTPLGANAQRIDVKGVSLGMPKAELLSLPEQEIECEKYQDNEGPATEICKTKAPMDRLLSPNDTFAGKSVSIQYFIHNNYVAKITIAYAQAADYQHFKAALTVKFGEPKTEVLETQNKLGASFQDEISTWWLNGDLIKLHMRGAQNINYSFFGFYSVDYLQAMKEWQTSQINSSVDDI